MDGKIYYVSELSDEELFVLWYLRGVLTAAAQKIDPNECPEWQGFAIRYLKTFGHRFEEAPDQEWMPIFRKGVSQLHDKGLVGEMAKDGFGGYVPKAVYWERIEDSQIIWSPEG